MANDDSIPLEIQWHEGMLLSPQHFQEQARRAHRLLHYHVLGVDRFHYGVVRLRIDSSLLFEGTLRVLELEAILPDGLLTSHRSGEREDLQIDLRAHADAAKQGQLIVYLAVPAAQSGRGDAESSRFDSLLSEPVADEVSGTRPIQIPRLRPRLRLLCGSEPPPSRFVTIPLCGLRWKGGAFVLSEYIPPQILVSPDSALGELCQGLLRRVREKATYLVEVIRSPAISTKPAVIEENRRIIAHLVAELPALEAMVAAGACSPLSIYVALCRLAGNISPLGSRLVPPIFPVYDHLALRRCIDAVGDYLKQTLAEGVSDVFLSVPFVNDGTNFTLHFEREWLGRVLILSVKGPASMSDQQLHEWMSACLIGASSRFRQLRERRMLGVERRLIDRYEGLIATRGTLLYQITVHAELVIANEPLQIGPGSDKVLPGRPSELVLHVSNK